LQSVQKALRAGQGQHALELLDSPGSQLEHGDFAAEARLMRIEALAGTGRRSEATSLAREFLKLFPHSPLADRARRFAAPAP
jgi:outer membrane protein assembly factor BamD (BamD/ComL family)